LVSLVAGAVGSAIMATKAVSTAQQVMAVKKKYGLPIFK